MPGTWPTDLYLKWYSALDHVQQPQVQRTLLYFSCSWIGWAQVSSSVLHFNLIRVDHSIYFLLKPADRSVQHGKAGTHTRRHIHFITTLLNFHFFFFFFFFQKKKQQRHYLFILLWRERSRKLNIDHIRHWKKKIDDEFQTGINLRGNESASSEHNGRRSQSSAKSRRRCLDQLLCSLWWSRRYNSADNIQLYDTSFSLLF